MNKRLKFAYLVHVLFACVIANGRHFEYLRRGHLFKVWDRVNKGIHMDMNIFIRQNFSGGIAFKNFISWRFESRFLCKYISGKNGGA